MTELSTFLTSDIALLVFSALGLLGTAVAIARDIPLQREVVKQPIRTRR